LHTFLNTTGVQLNQDDKRQVYEAIGFVISAMPMQAAGESLRTFAFDILAKVHTVVTSVTITKQQMTEASGEFQPLH
jgi:transportin-3